MSVASPIPRCTVQDHGAFWRRLWRWLRAPVSGLLIALALAILLLLGCQERLIYFPPRHAADAVMSGPQVVERLVYHTDEGRQQAYWVPARHDPAGDGRIWLVFGGNGSSALGWGGLVTDADPTAAFLLIDYPGYGANQGTPSPSTILDGSEAAMQALVAHLGGDPAALTPRLGVFGHSLGCAAAVQYAARHPVQRLVLVAPFTRMLDMARRVLGWPLCQVLTHRFDNRARLAEILATGTPDITIIHGDADEVIPVAMGRALAREFPVIVYRELPGADHNGILAQARSEIAAAMRR